MRDRDTGRSLTPHPGRAVLALGPVDQALVAPGLVLGPVRVDLVLADPGDRVEVTGPAVLVPPRPVGRAVLADLVLADLGDRVVLTGLVVPEPPRLVDPAGQLGRAGREAPVVLVGMGRVDLAARLDLVDLVQMAQVVRVELTSRVDLAVLDPVARAGLVDRVDPAVPDLTGRADLAAPVDRRRRHTSNTVSMTGVAPRWAAPGTCRTGLARRITVHHLRRGSTDSVGTVGLPPGPRRLSGTDRRPQVAGAVLRLPVVGTAHGTVRRAISQSRKATSGRLITTGTTRSRCLTRCSVGGASGSSVSGYRCTDLTRD